KRSAVREYLTLAFNFQRAGDKQKAIQAAERAQRLEPNSPQVLNSLQAIQSDALMTVPDVGEDRVEKPVASNDAQSSLFSDDPARPVSESHPDGPLGEATEKAMTALAEIVMSGDLSPATGSVIQGIELQKIGEDIEASNA